jgi:hypothetical protein
MFKAGVEAAKKAEEASIVDFQTSLSNGKN